MGRVAEIGLVLSLFWAVLAYGGTEPPYFSLVQVLLLGLSVFLLLGDRPRGHSSPRVPVVVPLLLVGLVVLQLVPLPTSVIQLLREAGPDPSRAYSTTISMAPHETLSHLLLLLTYLAAFYLTLRICRQREGIRRLVLVLVVLAALESFYGLVQYLTGWEEIVTPLKRISLGAATGTYINRNHFAGLLALILPFAFVLAFYESSKAQQERPGGLARVRDFFIRREFHKLIFWPFLVVILFTALVFSRSRTGILAGLVSLLTLIALVVSSSKHRKTWLVLAAVSLFAVSLMVIWIGLEPVIFRFEQLEEELAFTGQGRLAVWRDTLHLIRQHPWLGSGFGTFPISYTAVQTAYPSKFVNHAHNDYLELASDLGLPGALLFFASLCYLLGRVTRSFRAGPEGFPRAVALGCAGSVVVLLLISLTDFNLYIPGNALVFSVILGLSYATSVPWRRRSLTEAGGK